MKYPIKQHEKIHAGSLFFFTAGEWSGFHVIGVFRAVQDIEDPDEEIAKDVTIGELFNSKEPDDTIARLIREGKVEEVDAIHWYAGS